MKRLPAIAFLCVATALPLSAAGTAARTFVSFSGLDTNPCSRTAPCRSFNTALTQTAVQGTVVALDSAGYGTITIGQSVSIVAPEGVYAGIAAPMSGDGITVSGTTASDVVYLRGLFIEGSGIGNQGINLNLQPVDQLHIEKCVITGFVQAAINFLPSNSGASLFVAETTTANNGTGLNGAAINASITHVSADRCRFNGNNYGFFMNEAIGTITNSVISGNTSGLFSQWSDSTLTIEYCQITNNATGVTSQNGANVYMSNSTVTDNVTGLARTGINVGNIWSRVGDTTYVVKTNTVIHNGTNGTFTGVFTAQ